MGCLVAALIAGWAFESLAAEPAREQALEAMRRGAAFFREQVSVEGGYVWQVSNDLKHRQGEAVVGAATHWVQPPGTPAVGTAYLEAYLATGEQAFLDAAVETARALVHGQLESGGWNYRVELAPADRAKWRYRVDSGAAGRARPLTDEPGGWDVWKKRKHKGDVTMLDDDTTPSAIRLLMRVDKQLGFRDEAIHEA